MSQIEIIVSGHSSDEDSKIKLPKNVEVMFYAQPKETCYLPDDIDSLNGIIQSMKNRDGDLVKRGKKVNNYNIEFYGDDWEGVFDMNHDEVDDKIMNDDIDMEDLIEALTNKYPGKQIKLYAIFCRGSAREDFAQGVGEAEENTGLQWGENESDLGFTGGKKKKKKRKHRHQKKHETKRKTKRKSKKKKKRKTKNRRKKTRKKR